MDGSLVVATRVQSYGNSLYRREVVGIVIEVEGASIGRNTDVLDESYVELVVGIAQRILVRSRTSCLRILIEKVDWLDVLCLLLLLLIIFIFTPIQWQHAYQGVEFCLTSLSCEQKITAICKTDT